MAGIEAGDGGEFVGVLDGQRVEDQGVDEGEDGGVGADPDGQGEDDDEDENRIAADAAQGVAEVFPDAVEEVAGGFLAGAHGLGLRHARVPFDSVLEGIVRLEFGDGFAVGGVFGGATGDEFTVAIFQVLGEFFGEFAFGFRSHAQGGQAAANDIFPIRRIRHVRFP